MIFTVTLNPAIDRTIVLERFRIGEVNRAQYSRNDIGGKGINVSKVLNSLSAKSTAVGFLGSENSDVFLKFLKELSIYNSFYLVNGETRTNIKIVDMSGNTYTDINEKGLGVKPQELESFIEGLLNAVKPGDIAVLSGSISQVISPDIYKNIIISLKEKGIITVLDADGEALRLGVEGIPFAVKPNIKELGAIADIDGDDMNSIISGAKTLLEKGIRHVMVSLDSRGILYITETACLHASAPEVAVKSTVGAGDAVVAALAYSLQEGFNVFDTLKLACACGTASVMTDGTTAPSFELIKEIMQKVNIKIIDSDNTNN